MGRGGPTFSIAIRHSPVKSRRAVHEQLPHKRYRLCVPEQVRHRVEVPDIELIVESAGENNTDEVGRENSSNYEVSADLPAVTLTCGMSDAYAPST